MGKNILALLLSLSLGLLLACQYPDAPEPTPTPALATPTPTPAPTATPAPTPTPVVYSAADFLPFEDVHIHYEEAITETMVDSYVEYYNFEKQLLQRKTVEDERARVEMLQLGDGALTRVFEMDDVAYIYNFTDNVAGEAEVLIAEPISVGNQWPVQGGVREITALEKHMPVPIGSYAALEVTTNLDSGARMVQYYMKNIGLVAEYAFNPNGVMTRKLEAQLREKGKAQTRSVRFYYADPTNNCVSYVVRDIELSANVNMRDKFANELRNVPGDKTLIPLSPNVRILSLQLDFNGGVTVDFSRQLVEEMSLGNKGELLLLRALADTFGDYFGASRVYILVEGEDYISPNLMLLPGEYFTPNPENAKRA